MRQIPSVDKVLAAPEVQAACRALPRPAVVGAVRAVLDQLRRRLMEGRAEGEEAVTMAALAPLVANAAQSFLRRKGKRVINATGIVIHTNLGRAPLARAAIEAAAAAGDGYSNLEFDLATGKRGERSAVVEALLVELTGAQAALVVNNNAAALLLVLAALAKGKETVVSRGELIEIGGSFRLPEVMAAAGSTMREVGTTNKTHLRDYEQAVTKKTGLLMKIHTSNYAVVGFTSAVSLPDLVALGRAKKRPVVEDLGSGNLVDLPGLSEPTVQNSVKAGADIVTFSGDKLLGGPQCGLVVGTARLISELRRHPVYRAVRLDKLNLAALEATLRLYLYDDPFKKVPVLSLIAQAPEAIEARADKLIALILPSPAVEAGKTATMAMVGGGALPGRELPGFGVRLSSAAIGADEMAASLRQSDLPIIGRIEEGAVILDMTTVSDGDIEAMATQINKIAT